MVNNYLTFPKETSYVSNDEATPEADEKIKHFKETTLAINGLKRYLKKIA